jgi:ectoine hydroxylase-related dioxygenase (phytanoyl-CoA dioxygenase family)
MNDQDLEFYKRNGYCLLKGVIPSNLSTELLNDIHRLFSLQLNRFKQVTEGERINSLSQDMKLLLERDVQAYLAAARRSAKLVKLHQYLTHPSILNIVEYLNFEVPTIVSEPVLHISSDELVIPNGYNGFETHQDWPSIQGSLDCIVVWTPLVDINKINFPLQVLPGSHLNGLYAGKISENLFEIDSKLYDAGDYISIEASAGDVVIMSSWTLHRTGIEQSKGFRISCSTRYDNSGEPTFIERNFPCAYQRTVNRDFITPGFPEKSIVKKIFE